MYWAELQGKLSSRLEEAEDILTSNVFSFFKYCNRATFLRRYLVMLGFEVSASDAEKAKLAFWPRLDENTEPDLVIRVGGQYILFEAKYHSGFGEGSGTTKAQLMREVEGGMLEAHNNGEVFSLIAITADYCYKPHKFAHLSSEHMRSFRWTNWHKITALIEAVLEEDYSLTDPERKFAGDLYNLLCKKKLREYRGLAAFEALQYCPSSFGTIFFNATTASFRGDFIGFSTCLPRETGLVAQPTLIFFDAAGASFRGDFIGFGTSLSRESGVMGEPTSIFLDARVAAHHGHRLDRDSRARESHSCGQPEMDFFTFLGTKSTMMATKGTVFFGSDVNGEQGTDS
jgi:hypothetical protein